MKMVITALLVMGSEGSLRVHFLLLKVEKFLICIRYKLIFFGGSVNLINDTSSELWHRRLGHMSVKWINWLAKKNVVPGTKEAKLDKCVHCLAGKQKLASFKSHHPSRKLDLLELVHSDMCGPLKVKSYGGSLCFVTFIDDHSRKLWFIP